MKDIYNYIMQFFNQNDYLHHLRQLNIFEQQYMTGVRQSNWYVVGICQKKKPYELYNAVDMGFGIWLRNESHKKVIFSQTTVYRVVYEKFGIHALYEKKLYKNV